MADGVFRREGLREEGPDHGLEAGISYANRVLEQKEMTELGDWIMEKSPLIDRLSQGDKKAIEAFFPSFGNFVQRFPGILDTRVRKGVSRTTMRSNPFGREVVLPNLVRIISSVRTMRQEESEHAGLWWNAARGAGVNMDQDNVNTWNTPEMERLTTYADTDDVRQALAAAKATEEIAGALSRRLLASPRFLQAMGGEFQWGEVHVSPEYLESTIGRNTTEARGRHNETEIEHDDVDKLLLLAHDDSENGIQGSKSMIREGMKRFAEAAFSVERRIN